MYFLFNHFFFRPIETGNFFTAEKQNLLLPQELEHPLKEALQTYVHILILHSILGNYLQTLRNRNGKNIIYRPRFKNRVMTGPRLIISTGSEFGPIFLNRFWTS